MKDFVGFFVGASIVVLGIVYWTYSMAGILWLAEAIGFNRANPIILIGAVFSPIVIPMMIAGVLDSLYWKRADHDFDE